MRSSSIFGWLLFALAAPTFAADGAREINQACATNGGCFSGDPSGFPVTITTSGSYVVTSNMVVPTTGLSAIRVRADDVSVDLNGFTLQGQVTCTGAGAVISCTGSSGGVAGVRANGGFTGTTVKNGIIRGFNVGVWLDDECHVERVISSTNTSHGLLTDRHCRLIHNVVIRNGANGIDTDRGNVLFGNVATKNGGTGIRMRGTASSVRVNVAGDNGGNGIVCFRNCVVEQNSISFNELNGLVSTGDGTIANGNAACANAVDQMVLSGFSGYTNNVVQEGAKSGGRVTSGKYMPENVCNGSTGLAICETVQ